MKVLTLSVIVAIFGLVLLAAFIRTTAGHPDPGIGKIFEGSWVDKYGVALIIIIFNSFLFYAGNHKLWFQVSYSV